MSSPRALSHSALQFAWLRARDFASSHRSLLAWFALTSLGRTATTVAVVFLIRDFLGGVLLESEGFAATLSAAIGRSAALWAIAGTLLVVFFAGGLCMYASQLAQQRLIRLLDLDLIEEVITHLLRLPVAFFNQRHRGDLVESIRQDVAKTRAAVAAMADMVVSGAQTIAYVGSAAVISPRLVLVSLPVLLLTAVPGKRFARRSRLHSVRIRGHGYRLTDLLLQLLDGVRIVKVYGGEAAETQNSIATAKRYFRETMAATRVRALGDMFLETIGGLNVVVVTIVGGFEVMAGRLTMPALVASLIALRAAHGPLNGCFARVMDIHWNWASIDRLRKLLQTEPDIQDAPDAIPFSGSIETIQFKNVSFAYDGGPNVLSDVSAQVRAGQRVGVVGPSGAGKTTLLSLLARFYDPVSGQILINGRDLRDYRRADIYRHLALVTQDLFVFGTSVRENIRYGCSRSDEDVVAAAVAADIHDDILNLPHGYDTVLGIGGRLLSAGQIQRVSIARAILKNAPLVILDEATSHLDSVSEAKIQAALERLMHGRTTFAIAHRLSTLRRADLIVVLERGRCVATGTHDALMDRCDLYRELWHAQQMGTTPAVQASTAFVTS
jgi:ABC-type multidrug transport system fused ATPase/permease subunit